MLFCAAVAGGSWYFLSTQSADSYQSLLKFGKKEKKEETTTTPTTTDETANWKTYNNTTYGFSVKYPTDYFFSEATPVEIKAIPNEVFFVNFYNNDFKIKPDVTAPLKVELITNSGDDLKNWIAFFYKGTGSGASSTIKAKTVNGLSGYTFDFYPDDSGKKMTGFATTKNGKYYSITASSSTSIFNNFLNSLKIN